MSEPGFGVYIHWPFCAAKCPYCDFNSHVRHEGWDEQRFLEAYVQELRETHARIGARTIDSIFIGGGTPSLMQPSTVAALLDEIGRIWTVGPAAEITIEANPGSVEATRFAGFRTAGVNRVSIGVQALNDADLRSLGRIHSVAEARAAIAVGFSTFDRVSFDLIYARPGQTVAQWRDELTEALAMGVSHLSLYQLTIEPATPFERLHRVGKLIIPGDDQANALYEVTQDLTAAAGLPAYEISNHAKSGEESRHNLLYWRYGEYAGIGPGAHGRLKTNGTRIATSTERHPERWLERIASSGHGRVEEDTLTAEQCADEALLMGLRLVEGLPLARIEALSGRNPTERSINKLLDLGLIEWITAGRIRATASGRMVLNEIVRQLSNAMH